MYAGRFGDFRRSPTLGFLLKAAMTPLVFPANPGFFAVERIDGMTFHLPVIGWWVREMSNGELDVWAVGVDGKIDGDCPVYGPDGKLAHV